MSNHTDYHTIWLLLQITQQLEGVSNNVQQLSDNVQQLSNNMESLMSGNTDLQTRIDALTQALEADRVEVGEVLAAVQGMVATISALNARIQANPSPEQLNALDAYVQQLNTDTQKMADAVAAIPSGDVTPPTPAPGPTPEPTPPEPTPGPEPTPTPEPTP